MEVQATELLERLTQADAVPGHEDEVRDIFRAELHALGTIAQDRFGNVHCAKVGAASGPRILLDSHMDEVGFLVQRVTPSGFVKIVNVGGWWPHTLLAQRVRIGTKKGKVPGVIGATPPHLLGAGAREKVMKIEDLFIDIGASSLDEAESLGVVPGCPIAPYSPFLPLADKKLLSAKAFDNRVGVGLVIQTLQGLADHPNTVIGVGCAQEEVGLRGARAYAASVEADLAIVLEGSPADDTPGADRHGTQGRVGGGVQIRLFDPTMIAHPALAEFLIETAKQNSIPHQVAVRVSGGTNAGAIHQAPSGIPSVVVGVPARYIHSHVSIIHIDDYLAARELLLRAIPQLDEKRLADLFGTSG